MTATVDWRLTTQPLTKAQAEWVQSNNVRRGVKTGTVITMVNDSEVILKAYRDMFAQAGIASTLETRAIATTEWEVVK